MAEVEPEAGEGNTANPSRDPDIDLHDLHDLRDHDRAAHRSHMTDRSWNHHSVEMSCCVRSCRYAMMAEVVATATGTANGHDTGNYMRQEAAGIANCMT